MKNLTFIIYAVLISITHPVDATANPLPYWEDDGWHEKLVTSIKLSFRYLEDDDLGFPPSSAVVEFDYQNGKLKNASIVTSTGLDYLDKIILDAIAKATPPASYREDVPAVHHFKIDLDVEPNSKALRSYIDSELVEKLHLPFDKYPDEPTMIYVDTNYVDGKFIDIKMDGAPGSDDLQSLIAGILAAMPLPQSGEETKGRKLNFEMSLCVSRTFQACLHNVPGRRSFGTLSFAVTP